MEKFKTCEEYVLVELEEKKALIRKSGCSWKLCRGHRLVQVQCPFASEGESLLFFAVQEYSRSFEQFPQSYPQLC